MVALECVVVVVVDDDDGVAFLQPLLGQDGVEPRYLLGHNLLSLLSQGQKQQKKRKRRRRRKRKEWR